MSTVILRETELYWRWEACIVKEDLEYEDDYSANNLTVIEGCGHSHYPNSKREAICCSRLQRKMEKK